MARTKRDLIKALADAIGGPRGERMHAVLSKPGFGDLAAWEEEMSEEAFASQFESMHNALQNMRASGHAMDGLPGTWGLAN